jgi:fused signal recognition particle receptor
MLDFFKKLISPIARMKSSLGKRLKALFSKPVDESLLSEMERLLYEADLGSSLTLSLIETVRQKTNRNSTSDEVFALIRKELLSLFSPKPPPIKQGHPHVIFFVGVNGSGKTTSLAKIGARFRSQGKTVLIGAADTFRAAAAQQLQIWANRIGASLVQGAPSADSAAVAFDALSAAIARSIDVVLIDTAGRLQNKTDLMKELEKMRRVCQKKIGDAPHETLLVLDATVGQNALDQALIFHEFTPLTGIILTKLDGSAKGGIAAAIQKEAHIPIQWVGLGEQEDDLVPFDPTQYVDALLN